MSTKRFSEYSRFVRLRAAWALVRGYSVMVSIDIDETGTVTSNDRGLFLSECMINGKYVGAESMYHLDPTAQPDTELL